MKKAYTKITIIAILVYFIFGLITQILYNRLGDLGMKVPDAPSYVWAGSNFFHSFKADPMRPLGYPVIIGFPFLFNASLNCILSWGIIINAVMWLLTAIFIYKTIKLFTNESYAFTFGIIFILCVGNLEYTYLLLSENVYTFILTLFVYLVSKYSQKKELIYLGEAFLVFSFSMLVRPTFFPLLPLLLLVLLWVARKKSKITERKTMLKFLSLIALGLLLVIGQLLLMKKDYNSYTISYNGDRTTYIYLDAYANSMLENKSLSDERNARIMVSNKLLGSGKYFQYDSICKADMKFQVVHNTRNLLKAWKTDIWCNMIMPGDYEDLKNVKQMKGFETIINICSFLSGWQNIVFSLFLAISILLVIVFKKRLSVNAIQILILNYFIFCALVAISGISFWQYNRFSIVYTPLALVSVALLMDAVRNKTQTVIV